MDDKAVLRARLKRERSTRRDPDYQHQIRDALPHLLDHPRWRAARTVALYAALPGEPDLSALFDEAWSAGKRIALPITPARGHPLGWREHLADVPLVRGRFDVPVPPPEAGAVTPPEIDLVVVPGLGVDRRGYRIGYGGGYYDRSLPTLVAATSVWIGSPDQVVEAVPEDAFDQPVDELITRLGTWRASR